MMMMMPEGEKLTTRSRHKVVSSCVLHLLRPKPNNKREKKYKPSLFYTLSLSATAATRPGSIAVDGHPAM